jgi:hypothetical protein
VLPSVLVYGAVTLVAALCAALMGLPSLFAAPIEGRAAISLAAGALLAAVVVLGGRLLEKKAWYARMGDILREPVKALLGPKAGAPEAAIVALSSAMGEEAGFRGLIQPGLVLLFVRHLAMEPRPAILLAILTTAFSFMLLHPPWKKELRPWTFFALLMGVLWGLIAAWSGSLAAPMLSHFLVNFFNLRRLLAWQPSV